MRSHRFLVLILALTLAGCGKSAPEDAAPGEPTGPRAVAVPAVTVRDGDPNLIFRYYDPDEGKMKTARKAEDVPAIARARVIVHDERYLVHYRAGQPLTVADLRSPTDDGRYPSETVDPYAFSSSLPRPKRAASPDPTASGPGGAANRPAPAVAGVKKDDILLFSTEWCPHCRTARAFLQRKGARFTERDVEKDPRARPLLAELGRAAGVDPALLTSVPILWIKGKLLLGFDEKEVARLLL